MVVKPLSKSSKLSTYKWQPPRAVERPRPLREDPLQDIEALRGEVRGQPATDIEERLYYSLVKKYGSNKVDFQPTVIGTRNIIGEIRPDFVVDEGMVLSVWYADGEYAHKSAEQKERDSMQDEILFHRMQGAVEFPIRIPGDDLQTQEDADKAVEEV